MFVCFHTKYNQLIYKSCIWHTTGGVFSPILVRYTNNSNSNTKYTEWDPIGDISQLETNNSNNTKLNTTYNNNDTDVTNNYSSPTTNDNFYFGAPHSLFAVPIYNKLGVPNNTDQPVAYLFTIIALEKFLPKDIPDCATNTIVIVRNTCGDSATYRADHGKVCMTKKNFF